jgi:threonyl-tRNA synthetase
MRIAELVKLYRYEQSGELMGIQRTRTFCLADAHIICADENQAMDEINQALDLIEYVTGVFGLKFGIDYWYRLSLGDPSNTEKYYKNDAAWEKGEDLLRKMLKKRGQKFDEAKNEAAFYGPKIDIQMKNANGKEDTAFTVQYDFCMPDRFDLTYIGPDGEHKRAFVVHRSSIGAIERIMAFLIERYAGAFPLWLSPVQVKVLPISEKQNEFAQSIVDELKESGIRVEFDDRNESVGKKIRDAETNKVPYMLIIGEKEATAKSVSVRGRNEKDLGVIKLDKFIEKIQQEIKNRSL